MLKRLKFIYRAYRYRYRVDRAELAYVCSSLSPGDVAIDVGCHKGAYTYWMRRRVGASGRVLAFEPQPTQVDYLRHAFAEMRYANVTLVPQALSNAEGRLELRIPVGSGASTHGASLEVKDTPGARWKGVEVEVTTLDASLAEHLGAHGGGRERPRVKLIKVDVEGHESAVLEGAARALREHRPKFLVECEARHRPDQEITAVVEFFRRAGYRGSFFRGGQRVPLEEFDAVRDQPRIARNETPPPGYVNNFAFEPC